MFLFLNKLKHSNKNFEIAQSIQIFYLFLKKNQYRKPLEISPWRKTEKSVFYVSLKVD